MKNVLTIVLAWASLGFMLTFAAGSFKNEPGAADSRGNEPCASVDAQTAPTAPLYQRGARIIQVPQTGRLASVNDRDEPDATNDDDEDDVAPPPRRRPAALSKLRNDTPLRPRAPRWGSHGEVPAQPAPRAMLSVPPPQALGPTPIRPIPRFGAKVDPAEKFSQPRDANAPPPSGAAELSNGG